MLSIEQFALIAGGVFVGMALVLEETSLRLGSLAIGALFVLAGIFL